MSKNKPFSLQTISASAARKNFFQLLNQVSKQKQSYIIEKNGLPVAKIINPQLKEFDHQMYAQILKTTQGTWSNQPRDKQLEQEKKELELNKTARNKQAW